MNPIHRFLQMPLWVIILAILLKRPAGKIEGDDLEGYFKMYRDLMSSIRWIGRNQVEHRLITRMLKWIEGEQNAISELEMLGVAVVQPIPDPSLKGRGLR